MTLKTPSDHPEVKNPEWYLSTVIPRQLLSLNLGWFQDGLLGSQVQLLEPYPYRVMVPFQLPYKHGGVHLNLPVFGDKKGFVKPLHLISRDTIIIQGGLEELTKDPLNRMLTPSDRSC